MLVIYIALAVSVAALIPILAVRAAASLQKELLDDLAVAQNLSPRELLRDGRRVSKGAAFAAFFLLASIAVLLLYQLGQSAWVYCVFVFLLGLIALVDWAIELIPEWATEALLWSGLFASLFEHVPLPIDKALVGVVCGWLLFTLPNFLLEVFQGKKDAVGLGDVSFLAGLGAWLGPKEVIYTALLSIGLALGVKFWLRVKTSEVQYVAFGPFMSLSALVVLINSLF